MKEIFDFEKLKTFVTGKPIKMRIDAMSGGMMETMECLCEIYKKLKI